HSCASRTRAKTIIVRVNLVVILHCHSPQHSSGKPSHRCLSPLSMPLETAFKFVFIAAVSLTAVLVAQGFQQSEPFSLKIGGKDFPADFCTKSGKAISLKDLLESRAMTLRVATRLMRFGEDICSLNELLARNSSPPEAIGVFAQSADMREFCRLTKPPGKSHPYHWVQGLPNTGCGKRSPNRGQHLAWEHLKLYRFQSCALLCLMCLCCYVYGRILSLRISPITRLRRLNWTTENFIWAYKNF
ncbi:hypothetical protein BOX15_Mlig010156g1, partial [Macrostomum lignano]